MQIQSITDAPPPRETFRRWACLQYTRYTCHVYRGTSQYAILLLFTRINCATYVVIYYDDELLINVQVINRYTQVQVSTLLYLRRRLHQR